MLVIHHLPILDPYILGSHSIAEISQNATAWDGTLVSLPVGSFVGGNGSYTGTLTYTDSMGNINSMVQSSATFAGTAYPALVDALTGIARVNNDKASVGVLHTFTLYYTRQRSRLDEGIGRRRK